VKISRFVQYCRTLFFCYVLILRFSYVENSLHFNFADFPDSVINYYYLFPVSVGICYGVIKDKQYFRLEPCNTDAIQQQLQFRADT